MSGLEITLFVISIILILLGLLTGGKSEGASGAITGGTKMNIFAHTKERGVKFFLTSHWALQSCSSYSES